MSWLIRGLGAFFALIVVYLALMFGASESGEVVELITKTPTASNSLHAFGLPIMTALCGCGQTRVLGGMSAWCSTMRSGLRRCCAAMRHTR